MKFTKEEISLCKQVREKHRKEIKYGDWSLNEGGFVKVWPYRYNCKRIELIPLWQIPDCLEFLKGRFRKLRVCSDDEFEVEYWLKSGCYYQYGKTPLEACLKAVLAVLEEK